MDTHDRPIRRVRRVRSTSPRGHELAAVEQGAPSVSVRELPVLPVRNAVLLPNMVVPLFIDRDPALRAVEDAMNHDRTILIVSQRSEEVGDPLPQDVYHIGTECAVNRVLRMPDGASSVLIQGLRRFRIDAWLQQSPFGRVRGVAFDEPTLQDERLEALARTVLGYFESCTKLSPKLNEDSYIQALNLELPGALADFVVTQIEPPLAKRQEILEALDPHERLRQVCLLMRHELSVLQLEQRIQTEVQHEVDRGQREYYLREQLKVIQRELGEHDPALRDSLDLRARVEAAGMPEQVRTRALKEVERMEGLPSMAPEYGVLRGYIDWLLALPWQTRTEDQFDLRRVADVLDAHHFGLEKVKDRILEFMAVRKLAPEGRAPILCLAGPPGVGKTSLGRSVAEALGRKFVRVSLGGVRDEAEIRGHRRTYVGALPGRIIQTMKLAGTTNPVFVLDEIDKLAADYRGDPAAALLEVLDPEQNNAFSDHYLEVPYDLSKVLFILTANVLHTIPAPLRDRMEVIEIPGYTEDEKAHIAERFLVSRLMRDTGLTAARFEIDEGAIRRVIHEYTFEAGVRNLDRELAAIMRRVARRVAEGRRHKATITAKTVPLYLGAQKYFPTEAEESDQVGVATGLAWTAAGGDLTTVEVMAVPGRGNVQLTGQLGDVMKESAQAALTFTRARAASLGLSETFHERNDIHVHLPAAGIPKDGPSAGMTMAIAMISALTGRAIRRDVAMTGEITLRGRIMPVGGIKEKVLAAHRAGITTIILPQRNLKDLEDVAPEVRLALTFVPVDCMDDVIGVALPSAGPQSTGELFPPPSGGMLTRTPPSPRALPDPLPAAGRVARPRARRTPVVVGQPTSSPSAI
ncbi:MAG: endopeptidase La [Ktedonobacterales bacterium]|nr:endopeptidase La [Ktedonobacterales bacterium]